MTATFLEPVATDLSVPEIAHYVCCDENRALCGLDMTDHEWRDVAAGTYEDCVVCADLVEGPCADPECPQVPVGGSP